MLSFIGIGASKSATSWIMRCLGEHPQICTHPDKEVHFFNDDERYLLGQKWYEESFGTCHKEQIIGEYTPTYLPSPQAAERIRNMYPHIKLIVCLRNPVTRALSNVQHLKTRNRVPYSMSAKDVVSQFPHAVVNSRYAEHLERFFDQFPRDRILIMIYEDIEKDPRAFIQRIYEFLDVDTQFVPKAITTRYNTSVARGSRLYWCINNLYLKLKTNYLGGKIISLARSIGLHGGHIETFVQNVSASNYMYTQQDKAYISSVLSDEVTRTERILGYRIDVWHENV